MSVGEVRTLMCTYSMCTVEEVTGCDVCIVKVPTKYLIFDGIRLLFVVLTVSSKATNSYSGV